MKLPFIIILINLLAFVPTATQAQEFDLDVLILSRASTVVDPSLYDDFKGTIENFFNGTKWTDEEFKDEEKIEGQVTFTITKEVDANTFVADLLIQTKRPVYMSSYKTTLLNYLDRSIRISYNPGQPIQRSDNSYNDELSSILTFYGYIMLGYDFDSFSPLGGDPYFKGALNVLNNLPPALQTSGEWSNSGGVSTNNRFWLQENMNNPRMRTFRQFFYEYHRLGLDGMYKDADRQRAIIASSFTALNDILEKYPNSMVLQLFAETKATELVDIFKVGDKGQRKRVYDIMVQSAPAQSSKYDPISVKS